MCVHFNNSIFFKAVIEIDLILLILGYIFRITTALTYALLTHLSVK